MHNEDCFDVSTYKSMLAGQLTAALAEKVCKHLEGCDRCCQVVRSLPEDTLVASMRGKGKWPTNAVEPAFVRDLAQKILKQRESRGDESASFVMFSCPGCANKLKVKNELIGQKVKCPKCGQVLRIPVGVPPLGGSDSRLKAELQLAKVPASASTTREEAAAAKTLPPKDLRSPDAVDAPTVPPVNPGTKAPVRKDDTSPASKPDTAHDADSLADRGLTDFLAPPQQPDEIGRLGIYRVLKVLGAGGMGVVYKAEDPGLKRLVAIKAMLPAIAASASAKIRFRREAQAAAAIKHNHIVTIFQVSEDRGVPFLAMEFLEGEPLDSRLKREGNLPMAEAMRIGREMAEGMAAAHERGLIHRDIKPANTWLEASPGRKSGEFTVKILDFGLARATDDQANLTQSGAIIGTPAYMAPEQGRGEKLDARCDLWSLGVVLYCMCTGELPFKGTDTISILMAVATTNPPPPAALNNEVPIQLSDLVMKLLEKDPQKRVGSAGDVIKSLQVLEGKTPNDATGQEKPRVGSKTAASPLRRKLWPWVAVGALGAAVLVFVALQIIRVETENGTLVIEINDPSVEVLVKMNGVQVQEKTQMREFQLKAGKGVIEVFEKDGVGPLQTKEFALNSGGRTTVTVTLEPRQPEAIPPKDNGKPVQAWDKKTLEVRELLTSYDALLTLKGHKTDVLTVGFSRDGKKIVSSGRDGTLKVWDGSTGEILTFNLKTDGMGFDGSHFRPPSALSQDAKKFVMGGNRKLRVWETSSGRELKSFDVFFPVSLGSLALSSDGKRIVTGSGGIGYEGLKLWDAATGEEILTLKGRHHGGVASVAFSPDGRKIVSGGWADKTARVWDAASGDETLALNGHVGVGPIYAVAFSEDAKRIVSGSADMTVKVWDATSGQQLTIKGHTNGVMCVAFSPDGKKIVSGSDDKTVKVWDAFSGQVVMTFKGHAAPVRCVAFSPDNKKIVVHAP